MNEKMPDKKILQEKILNILNEEQDKHNQINLDSQSARIYLAEKISYNLLKYGYRAWDRSHNYEQKNAK